MPNELFDSIVFPLLKVATPPAIPGAPPKGTNHSGDNDEPGKSSNNKSVLAVGVFVAVLVKVLVGVDGDTDGVGVKVGVLKMTPVVFCKIDTVVPSALLP